MNIRQAWNRLQPMIMLIFLSACAQSDEVNLEVRPVIARSPEGSVLYCETTLKEQADTAKVLVDGVGPESRTDWIGLAGSWKLYGETPLNPNNGQCEIPS